ncbi:MAG: hypothetical protein JW982_12365 [Spirochaetes bacterium]|nr:hypothetical protein [Spirochaetota bacterium]
MKKIILLTALMLIASTALFAEDNNSSGTGEEKAKPKYFTKTLIPASSKLTFSGYGAPTVGVSQINGNWVTTTGMRGGLIINGANQGVVIGMACEGVAYPNSSRSFTDETYPDEQKNVSIGWGGVLFEYHFMPRSLVHFSIGTTLGAGGIAFYNPHDDTDDDTYNTDSFFVAEPELAAYINITKFARLGAAASYRYSYGINTDGFSDADFRNFGGKILFEFGWF